MKSIKVSKNVTFTWDSIEVIEQMMRKTQRNFSVSVNILIADWVKRARAEYELKHPESIDTSDIDRIATAKVIKNV